MSKISYCLIYDSNVIIPLSAPRRSSRFSGRTAMVVKTPRKVSDLRRVDENEAAESIAVWTPILFAVVPEISSEQ